MSILHEMVSPVADTGVSPDSNPIDPKTLKEKIFGGRNKSAKRIKPESPPEETATEKELKEIFAGENWEELSALYFNARFAITGFTGFQLTDAQKKTLGVSLGACMKMLLKIDPGYIALLVFTTNYAGIIAQKELTYKSLQKKISAVPDGKPS